MMNEFIHHNILFNETTHRTWEEKEYTMDLHLLATIGKLIEKNLPNCFFVVTGSHAIQLLTMHPVAHRDIDANIITLTSLPKAIANANFLIQGLDLHSLDLHKKTPNRLEYNISCSSGNDSPRRLELQFISATRVIKDKTRKQYTFILKESNKEEKTTIPTIVVSRKGFTFRVKSLPYLIASWVLRVSGRALNPQRPLRDSDREHLRILLQQDYNTSEVLSTMKKHPQMPLGCSAERIFTEALSLL